MEEQSGDLLAEQRVPITRQVELLDYGPWKPSAGISLDHDAEGGHAERTDLDVDDTAGGGRDLDLRPISRPDPGDQTHLRVLDASQGELECSQRRRIAPLHVVERHEERVLLREIAQRYDDRQAEPERIDRVCLVRVDPAQCDVERPGLRVGQIELRRCDGFEQFREDAERKLCLGLCRTGAERSEARGLRSGERLL